MSATTSTTPAPRTTSHAVGSSILRAIRLGGLRIGYEVRAYFRQGDTVFFTFLFPVVMLTIFSVSFSQASFGQTADGDDVSKFVSGVLGSMMSASRLLGLGVHTPAYRGITSTLAFFF